MGRNRRGAGSEFPPALTQTLQGNTLDASLENPIHVEDDDLSDDLVEPPRSDTGQELNVPILDRQEQQREKPLPYDPDTRREVIHISIPGPWCR